MHIPLSQFVEHAYAALRVVAGLLFAFHGAQKLFGAFDGTARPIASQMGVAGLIEFGGGMLVVFGLFAALAAFLCSGEMAVAYLMAHAPRGGWPIQNDGELAALFCFLFLFIAARGSGIWSLDAWLQRRQQTAGVASGEAAGSLGRPGRRLHAAK
jgi:putative oxidoreductase